MAPFGQCLAGVLVVATLVSAAGCREDSSTTLPGAIPVRGSERLAWDQQGDVAQLRFQAYVDGVPVRLDAATCDAASPGPQGSPCLSPLPPLTDGVHTIALTAVSLAWGFESARSEAITVQKLPAGVIGFIAAPPGTGDVSIRPLDAESVSRASQAPEGSAPPIDDTLTTSDGQAFAVSIVASGLDAPTHLALAADGRLFVAERTGRVLVLRPSARGRVGPAVAFDLRTRVRPLPAGPPGLALHPDFARNHLAYVAYVAVDGNEQARLLIVRLQEVANTLGEPVVVVDEPLASVPSEGPRLAFGPDRLLYAALSEGVEFPPESPAALGGALLRFDEDGQSVDGAAPFAYGVEQPVAIAWHPDTDALWAVLAGSDGRATLRVVGRGASFGASAFPQGPAVDVGGAFAAGGLAFRTDTATAAQAPIAWLALPDNESLWRVTPGTNAPAEVMWPAALGRLGAIVQGEGGALFVATRNRDGRGSAAAEDDLVLRLTPRMQ